MLFKSKPYLFGRNTLEHWYIINLDTGAKVELDSLGKNAGIWIDDLTENDVKRAKEQDGKDLTSLYDRQDKNLIKNEECLKHLEDVRRFWQSEDCQSEIKAFLEIKRSNLPKA